jgi:undecaprenyl-diphosphatase
MELVHPIPPRHAAIVSRPLAAAAAVMAVAAAALSLYVAGHPLIPADVTVENDVQATWWGPLAYTFPFFSWIGDAKGAIAEAVVFVAVLIFIRRAWLIPAGASLNGIWYQGLNHLIWRPRPTPGVVLHVYEHPGASSYPSGHTMFTVTLVTVLMLCFGRRFLPGKLQWVGWAFVVLVIVANGIARVYTGAHWPTDVLGGILISSAWICFWVSLRFVSERVEGAPRERSASRPSLES